jgi:hypothetical protein
MPRFCLVLIFTIANAPAQTREPDDSWLMRNYRFAPAPSPSEIQPVSPTLARLQEVLQSTLSIMHKANHDGDYEAALAAAAQATATATLLGNLSGEIKPPPEPLRRPAEATKIWADRWMIHYLTPEGGHVQLRRDQIDWPRQCLLTPDFCASLEEGKTQPPVNTRTSTQTGSAEARLLR